jgi:tRNA1(Val) A37 N6-methylase TrmN6
MVDLGCGTGVLPIVMSENGGYTGKVYSFDNQANAIEATKMNSSIFGMGNRMTAQEADIVDLYYKDLENPESETIEKTKELGFYRELAKDLQFPFSVDLVVCNPPWIPADYVKETNPLDNGVYDPQEKFLKSALNFCRIHLEKNGEMLLIYSDLAYQLGLQKENRVNELAEMYGMRAELLDKTQLPLNKKPRDPLRLIKRNSFVELYKVTK